MEDDDEFGDLYTDVLQSFQLSQPSSSASAPPPPRSLHRPIDVNLNTAAAAADHHHEILPPPPAAPPQSNPNSQTLAPDSITASRVLAAEEARLPSRPSDSAEKEVNFDIEQDIGLDSSAAVIPGLSAAAAAGGEDWDSDDSEDDLQIVLNDNNPMGMERGGNGEEEEDDGLVIVTGGDHHDELNGAAEEPEWGEEGQQAADGERKEMGEAGKGGGGGAVAAPKIGYSNHGYHPFHSQFKYVRPGAVPMPGPTNSVPGGVPGQVRPLVNMGPTPGRGRGDWRPTGLNSGGPLQRRAQDSTPLLTTSQSTKDYKYTDNQKERSVESVDRRRSPLISSPVSRGAVRESSVEHRDGDQDEPLLGDESSGMEMDEMAATVNDVHNEVPNHQRPSSRLEQSADELDDGEDSKAARSTDNSKARSGSCREYQKWRDGAEEEVIQGRSAHSGGIKSHLDEKEQGFQRKSRDGRQELDRTQMLVKGREGSYPYRDWDPSSAHHLQMKNDGLHRRKERENLDRAWQWRDADPYSRRIRPSKSSSNPHSFQIFLQSPNPQIQTLTQTLTPTLTPSLHHLKLSLFPQTLPSSFFFTLNGIPLPDSSPLPPIPPIPPLSTLVLCLRVAGGGGDGGATGAESRDCYLNMYAEKKPDKVDPYEQRLSKFLNCSLSNEPLKGRCVVDLIGNVFNKEALVEALLGKKLPKAFGHIKGLKDMVDVHFSPMEGSGVESRAAAAAPRFQCPITGLEFNGKYRFLALRSCGHVLSAKALKEVKSKECLVCRVGFREEDKIVINGSEEEVAVLRERMEAEKAKGRVKKAKKVKNGEEEGLALSGTKHGVENGGENEKGLSNGPAVKKFKAVDVAPANATKEVYASIFTSSSKKKFKETYSCRSLPLGRN